MKPAPPVTNIMFPPLRLDVFLTGRDSSTDFVSGDRVVSPIPLDETPDPLQQGGPRRNTRPGGQRRDVGMRGDDVARLHRLVFLDRFPADDALDGLDEV